jgi:rhodanese-related sulfurtransferase
VIDRSRGDEPWAVLTGDTLFVNDVARPDLAIDKRDGARGIFHSLHEKLLRLPESCEVWPGHLGGSMCGGPGMDMKVSSTIGYERRHNDTLGIEDEEEFVEQAVASLGPQPPNFENIVALNRGALLTAGVEVLPLAPRQVEQLRSDGALVVDVRTDQQFDDAHVPGAVCVPMLHAGFGSRLAWLADRDQDIVFIGRDDSDGHIAAELAVAVGIRKLAGFLGGGMTSWRQEPLPVERIERLPLGELAERIERGAQVMDVREQSEFDAGHIPGSLFEPWHDIDGLPEGLDPEREVAVICGSGQRSAVAASLLQRYGAKRVVHVTDGGVPRWEREGGAIEK